MLWIWVTVAWADKPLPSFREEVARSHWNEIDQLLERGCGFQPGAGGVACADGVTDAAIAHAKAFRGQVFDDPGIAYLQGLAHRLAGEDKRAMRVWQEAVALDPAYYAAWYDMGELHLVAGRYAAAEDAFERVAPLALETQRPWIGYQRLAEVAALQHDAVAFEARVKEALTHGFSFLEISSWPNWQAFYRDPALKDVFDKLLTVYATEDARDAFEAAAAER